MECFQPHSVRRVAVVALLAASVLSVSCAQTTEDKGASGTSATLASDTERAASGPPRSGGRFIVGLVAETNSFNPYQGQWASSAYIVANAVFDPLAAMDPQGIAKPYLAESIAPTGDFLEWMIKLRPGIAFHNGEKLDSAALKKNLDTGRTSGLTSQAFAAVTSVDIVDDLTVSVKLNMPWATFPASLTKQAGYMAAPAMLDDPASADARPIGTGPFEVQEWKRDAAMKTKRNNKYWRKATDGEQLPYLEAVEFRVIADTGLRGASLDAGDVDAMEVLTPDGYAKVVEQARREEIQAVGDEKAETDETIIALNTSKEPFSDPNARKALQYAINQEQVASEAYDGAFPEAWGMFSPESPYYISKEEAGYPEYNPEKAKELVKQYEQEHGKPAAASVLVPPDPQYLAIAQHVQSLVEPLGMKVTIQAQEQTQLIQRVIATGDYEASGFTLWTSPTPDQSYIFLATKPVANGLSLNFSRFDDPELTAAMNEFRAAALPEKRIAAMKKVQQSLAKNAQVLFLVHNRSAFAYSNHTHGVRKATFPGSETLAYSPYITTPFLTFTWRDQA